MNKEAIVKYLDKGILGIAVLGLLYAGYCYTLDPVTDQVKSTVQNSNGLNERLISEQGEAPVIPAIADATSTVSVLSVSAEAAKDWLGHKPTEYTYENKDKPIGPKLKEYKHASPVIGDVTADRDGVTVAWEAGKIKEDPDTIQAEISGYVVERKVGEDGKWEALQETPLASDVLSFVDNDVNPLTEYSYRIVAVTDDENYKGDRMSSPSKVGAATTPDNTEVWLTIASTDVASVMVKKWIKGQWREATYTVKPGDAIGKADQPLRIDGERANYDFTTGLTFQSVEDREIDKIMVVTEPVFNEDTGEKIGEKQVEKVIKDKVKVLVAKDKDGNEVLITKNPNTKRPPRREKDSGENSDNN
jgi:hypothetical protein